MKSQLTNSWVVREWSNMNSIKKAVLVGIMTVVVYLTVVVLTTPALEPIAAIDAAFQLNAIVIIGMGIGIGLQVYLSDKSKMLGCKLNIKRKAFGGSSSITAVTSFFFIFLTSSSWVLWMVALRIVIATKYFWNRCFCCSN